MTSTPPTPAPKTIPSPIPRPGLPAFGGIDFWRILFLAIAVGAVAWVQSLYQTSAPRSFPRDPAAFRTPDVLAVAAADAEARLAKNPQDLQALFDAAMVEYERGPARYRESLTFLEKARDLGLLDDRLFFYAGAMYESLNVSDYAAADFERFLKHHPEDLDVRVRLANLYYRLDDVEKSVANYRAVLAQKPGDPLVSFNLAYALRDEKEWAGALEALAPFLKEGRSFPTGGRKLLGDIYRGQGDLTRALGEYNAEFLVHGESAGLARAVAETQESLGQKELALERWEQVVRLDPKNREAKSSIKRLKRALARR